MLVVPPVTLKSMTRESVSTLATMGVAYQCSVQGQVPETEPEKTMEPSSLYSVVTDALPLGVSVQVASLAGSSKTYEMRQCTM